MLEATLKTLKTNKPNLKICIGGVSTGFFQHTVLPLCAITKLILTLVIETGK